MWSSACKVSGRVDAAGERVSRSILRHWRLKRRVSVLDWSFWSCTGATRGAEKGSLSCCNTSFSYCFFGIEPICTGNNIISVWAKYDYETSAIQFNSNDFKCSLLHDSRAAQDYITDHPVIPSDGSPLVNYPAIFDLHGEFCRWPLHDSLWSTLTTDVSVKWKRREVQLIRKLKRVNNIVRFIIYYDSRQDAQGSHGSVPEYHGVLKSRHWK